jgi:outer membrane protein TolC
MRRIILLLPAILSMCFVHAQQKDLGYYLGSALQNSPLLADYQNRILSGKIDSMRIGASNKLQVNAQSLDYYAPVIHGWGYDEVITNGANVSALVEVSRQFTGRNNLLNQYRSVQLQNQSTSLESRISEQDLKKSVTAQYIDTYGSQQAYVINRDILNLLKEQVQIVKTLAESGVYKQTEYLSLLVNLRQEEVVTAQSFSQCQAALATLNYLCGVHDTAWVSLPDPALVVPILPGLKSSIFYGQFVTDSLKLATQDKAIDFTYRPKLSAFVDGGYNSSLYTMPWKNFGASAGLSLTVPIYDGRQRKMQHDQVSISEQTRSRYRDFFSSQYLQQTEMLSRQLASLEKLIPQLESQMNYSQTLVDANRKLLNSGEISITDYLLSMNNYLNAKNLILENRLSKYHLLNELTYWSKTK